MPFCPNCGFSLTQSVNYCPSCGSALNNVYVNPTAPRAAARNDYSLALVSCGTCRVTEADDLLEDILGYTNADAKMLVKSAPVEIACNLTETQAMYIARALTEYGMQISIYNQNGVVRPTTAYNTSIFDNSGNFVDGVAAALGVLTVANRVNSVRRYNGFGGSLLGSLFTMQYMRPTPPVHRRRIHPAPPQPHRPAPRPAPVPPRGAAMPPHPAPGGRPAPGRSPIPGGRVSGPVGGPAGGPGNGPNGRGPGGRGPEGHGPGGRGPMGGGRTPR